MFPDPPRPGLALSSHFALYRRLPGALHPYGGKTRVQCEECVWVLHEARGIGPMPRSARTTWASKTEALKIMLCPGHAELWRLQTKG